MSDKEHPSEPLHETTPVEESRSITGSGGVADDPKGPKFVGGPVMSAGTNEPPSENDE